MLNFWVLTEKADVSVLMLLSDETELLELLKICPDMPRFRL